MATDPNSITDKHSRAVLADRIGQSFDNASMTIPGKSYTPSPDYANALAGNYRDTETQRSLSPYKPEARRADKHASNTGR